MTKLIITILVVGLLGVITPHIYYHYNTIEHPPVIIPVVFAEEPVIIVEEVVKPKKKVTSAKTVIPVVTPETKDHIEKIFGEKAEIATAVFMHESGLILDKKGWNCHYYRDDGTRYSTHCKKEDRHKAWSVDCGLAQINVRGQECPKEFLTLEGNMTQVALKYEQQGLNAWVSYKTGAYKKFMQ